MPIIADLLKRTNIDARESELLLGFVLKKDRTYVLAHKTDALDARAAKRFMALIERRRKHEPIAYLTGSQPFCGRDFLVNKHTLIPRPETEILVDLVKRHLSRDLPAMASLKARQAGEVLGTRYAIVDIGTGSGCLAVSLALEYPLASVIASDTSDDALKVARKNARRLGAKVKFVKDNLVGPKTVKILKGNTVTFVANLPYLPLSDKKTMMPDVAKYEPSKALFAGSDGSSLIVRLLKQIRMLNFQCSVFLEIDPRQTKKLTALARQLFPKHEIKIERDLCGRERFLLICS